jgi:hypothetical protein
MHLCVCVCVCVCARACVRACVRACAYNDRASNLLIYVAIIRSLHSSIVVWFMLSSSRGMTRYVRNMSHERSDTMCLVVPLDFFWMSLCTSRKEKSQKIRNRFRCVSAIRAMSDSTQCTYSVLSRLQIFEPVQLGDFESHFMRGNFTRVLNKMLTYVISTDLCSSWFQMIRNDSQ